MSNANTKKSVSSNGISLLVKHEQFVDHLYNDMNTRNKKDGKVIQQGNCTIGEGTKVHNGVCDGRESERPFLQGISKEDAVARRTNDLQTVQRSINNHLTVEVNQNTYDALAVFVYNCGTGSVAKSRVYSLINDGKLTEAAAEMRTFVNATVAGKKIHAKGLEARREEETTLLLKPVNP